jgi:hypothetical protein
MNLSEINKKCANIGDKSPDIHQYKTINYEIGVHGCNTNT